MNINFRALKLHVDLNIEQLIHNNKQLLDNLDKHQNLFNKNSQC